MLRLQTDSSTALINYVRQNVRMLLSPRMLSALPFICGVIGCGAGEQAGSAVVEHRLASFDTLVTAESGAIGVVAGLALGPDGRVWMSDRVNHRLLVVDPASGESRTLGREGEGPGEFRWPEAIAASDTAVFAFDFSNRRIQRLRPDGSYAGSNRLEVVTYQPAAVGARGDFATPTLGRDGALVFLLPAGEEAFVPVGEALTDPPTMIARARIREQALRGEVPAEFRNNVLPVLGPDGELWLVHQATGVVERYEPGGALAWSGALPVEAVEAALGAFFDAWAADEGPHGIPVPWMATAGAVVDGDLWLRLGPGEEGRSVIASLDGATGRVVRRFVLELDSPAGAFAVDPSKGALYLALPEEAVLLRAELP